MKEHYLIWIENGNPLPHVAYNQKDALAIGDASGYKFHIQFVNDYSLQSN